MNTTLNDWGSTLTFKWIMDEHEQETNQHLANFELGWFFPLIEKYLDQYFRTYCEEEWVEPNDTERDKFKNEIMIPEIKEYYFLYREWDTDDKGMRLLNLMVKYFDLIYDWEEPDSTLESLQEEFEERLSLFDEIPTFTKEAERYWVYNETSRWLSETLSRQ